jgi:Zn-finger nucleic acid-binding protein
MPSVKCGATLRRPRIRAALRISPYDRQEEFVGPRYETELSIVAAESDRGVIVGVVPACPRCASVHRHELASWSAEVESGFVEVLGCEHCRGIFLRRDVLAKVCPTAGHLPDHSFEVALTGAPGRGIPTCPVCGQTPHEVDLVGVHLDFCTHCHGLWIDGDEYDEAALIRRKQKARAARSPYRDKKQAQSNTELCDYCHGTFPLEQLGYWEDGRVCRACMGEYEVATRMQRNWLTRLNDAFDPEL